MSTHGQGNAHITETFTLDDSDGLPVPHVRIRCVSGCVLMMAHG